MKTTLINTMTWISSLLLAALSADLALAQSRFAPYSGKWDKSGASDDSGQTSAAVVSGPILRVSKTAFVDGHEVCGVIRITNSGGQAATITGISDSLEVHFPRGATPPVPPPAGSTASWFKVADVPIELALPASIAPGATTTIPYCFSLCLAEDYAGANSMRNVVSVSLTNATGSVRTITTRSVSFPPPALDCQACCVPDGNCTDTVPAECATAGGLSKGIGTDCATTECTQACCRNGTCSNELLSSCQSGGEPLGLGTNCATTECPRPCCLPDGSCTDQGPNACQAAGGNPGFADIDCAELAAESGGCPQACCDPDGSCNDRAPLGCAGGTLQGLGTSCATMECPRPCCLPDGVCADLGPNACQVAGGQSLDPIFTPDCAELAAESGGCPQACCDPDGSCNDRAPLGCAGGTLQGLGTSCATMECPRPCCLPDGVCADLGPNACQAVGGNPGFADIDCAELAAESGGCPQACCEFFDGCNDYSPFQCDQIGGALQGPGTNCATTECPRPCCLPDGSCTDQGPNACQAAGGNPGFADIDCAELAAESGGCPQACCEFDGCNDYSPFGCGGALQGPGTTCATIECP